MSDIDFRDTLLTLRDKIGHSEHWWKQGNNQKAKEALLELSDIAERAADYHFEEIETIEEADNPLEKLVETMQKEVEPEDV